MKTYHTSSNDKINILDLIKDCVSIEQVVDDLNLISQYNLTRTGENLMGDCPTGHESTNHQCFGINTDKGFFYCFHCGETGDIIDLVRITKGAEFKDALRWLVERYKPEDLAALDNMQYSMNAETQQFYRNALLYEEVTRYGKQLLYEPMAKSALDALLTRGYSEENLCRTEWIYWPVEANIRSHLEQKYPHLAQSILRLSLSGYTGDKFRLAFPYRNRRRQITGFLKRSTNRAGEDGKRWDSTKGLDKSDLFGLYNIAKTDTVIIVEGYPDALYLPTLGLDNVVAVGQGMLSEKHLEGLAVKRIQKVIISFDNDPPKADGEITGVKNTERAVELLTQAGYEVFVVDPSSLTPHKDPDELVTAKGIDAFVPLLKNAEFGGTFAVRQILNRHDLDTALGKEDALQEALKTVEKVRQPLAVKEMMDLVSSHLQLPSEMLEVHFSEYRERKATESLRSESLKIVKGILQKIEREDPREAMASLGEEVKKQLLDYGRSRSIPDEPLDAFLRRKQQQDKERTAGDLLGYKLSKFDSLTRELSGLQGGLYILGAYPNVGKTALMVSMMIDLLKSNDDVSVAFFSMDDNRETIINRCLAFLTDSEINTVQHVQTDPIKKRHLDEAYDFLFDYTRSGRLLMRDTSEITSMDDIEIEVRQHPSVRKLAVFIDGLYNVTVDGTYNSIREENISRANAAKLLSKQFSIPVLTSAELRKKVSGEGRNSPPTMHDIMESGKYAYNADVVFLLYPQDQEQYDVQTLPYMTLKFAKNKLSSFRGEIGLQFSRAKSKFIELPTRTTFYNIMESN
jgi:DNA primase